MSNSRLIIDNPITFTALPFGLLSVVQRPTPANNHWQNGVTYQVSCTNSGDTTYDECINVTGGSDDRPPEPSPKENTTDLELRGATPFTVFTEFDCPPVGMDDATRIAEQALAQTTPWQVERAFWTGEADGQPVVFPHLAADTQVVDNTDALLQSVPTTGSATDVVCALGFLEEQLGDCYNGVGVIHVPRKVLPALEAWNLVEARGGQLRTRNGNLVAVGSGYPGTGPSGDADEQCTSWMFATGAVFLFHGGVRISDEKASLDRSTNTRKMIAERTYVIGWDCCHAAIEATLNVPVA